MNYLVFTTQALAQAAADQIATNMGMPLVGVNAATGLPDPAAQQTTSWDVPRQILGASGTPGTIDSVPAHPLYSAYPNQWEIAVPASQYLTGISNFIEASA